MAGNCVKLHCVNKCMDINLRVKKKNGRADILNSISRNSFNVLDCVSVAEKGLKLFMACFVFNTVVPKVMTIV